MSLETGTFISDLVVTNPLGSDPKAEGPGHLKLIKSTLKTTFPAIAGAVSASHVELSYSVGLTALIQTQINNEIANRTAADILKADRAGATFTGPVLLPAQGGNPAEAVRKDYAEGLAFNSALPAQAGNAGKFVTTNGSIASWANPGFVAQDITGTTQTGIAGYDYQAVNAAATTLTLPSAPLDGDAIAFTPANGRKDNAIDSGSVTVRGPSDTAVGLFLLDLGARMQLKYSSAITAWVVV